MRHQGGGGGCEGRQRILCQLLKRGRDIEVISFLSFVEGIFTDIRKILFIYPKGQNKLIIGQL
jgi:hypothetical protein